MALGADRYASRGDTFAFFGCVLLSVAAMSLPERIRDPLARGLRQTVLAPFLALQQQTELLSASLARYDAVVAQRDSAALAATLDRKSTRLNSSHEWISYAVFCLKKKKNKQQKHPQRDKIFQHTDDQTQ